MTRDTSTGSAGGDAAGKVRVAHLVEATAGGVRRHLLDLVGGLDRNRFSVALACSTQREAGFLSDLDILRGMGVDVTTIQMVRNIRPWRDVGAWLRLYGYLRATRPEIVHTHCSKAGFLGRTAARWAGVPVVVHTPHVFPFEMDVGGWRERLYLGLERVGTACCDRVICVCRSAREDALRRGLGPAEKFEVVENGISARGVRRAAVEEVTALRRELGIGEGELVVGAIGRFARQKGYEYLVQASGEVASEREGVRFVAVGEGEERAAIERLIDRLSLRRHFLLCAPRADPAVFYGLFDVLVLSSLWEGLPYVILEAMAHGTGIVATAVGGIPELLGNGAAGLLVPPKNSRALARGIVELLSDPARRLALGEKAKEAVRGHTAGSMANRVQEIYTGCLDMKRKKG